VNLSTIFSISAGMDVVLHRAAKSAAKVASGNRAGIALRLIFPIVLLEAALWAPLPIGILFGICALWYIAWQLWQAASNVRSLGLDFSGLMRETWLLGATLGLAAAVLATAYFSGSLHRLWGLQHPWYAVAAYVCWAFVQEFMLQCFCLQMLRALVSRVSALLLSGVVFAVAHLPNPSLTLVTFFAGVIFTAIYARKRNLYVVALIHAVLGLTLAVSAPDAWFHGLRVGRDFAEGPSTIAAGIPPVR
jgi:membrane protease YdiL (CAAX protease family)